MDGHVVAVGGNLDSPQHRIPAQHDASKAGGLPKGMATVRRSKAFWVDDDGAEASPCFDPYIPGHSGRASSDHHFHFVGDLKAGSSEPFAPVDKDLEVLQEGLLFVGRNRIKEVHAIFED